jgi:hypothetical protein
MWRNLKKTTNLPPVTGKLYHINVVSRERTGCYDTDAKYIESHNKHHFDIG